MFTIPTKVNYSCKNCGKPFATKFSLKRHAKKIHDELLPETTKLFQCTFPDCPSEFRYLKHLKKHKQTEHDIPSLKIEQKCPLCKEKKQHIIQHFKDVHDIEVVVSEHSFDSFSSFESWKGEIERSSLSFFRKYRNDEMTDTRITSYYKCHRSGDFISKSKGKKRMKKIGSVKIDGFCPASFKVKWNEGKCKVTFTETHVGHECDLRHLTLSKEDKFAIAAKMASEIPFDAILDDVRTNVGDKSLERIQLLTRKDLHNIKKCFNLPPSTDRTVRVEKNSVLEDCDSNSEQDICADEVSHYDEAEISDLEAMKSELKDNFCKLIDSLETPDHLELMEETYKSLVSELMVEMQFE